MGQRYVLKFVGAVGLWQLRGFSFDISYRNGSEGH
jgi:hypothetical protein